MKTWIAVIAALVASGGCEKAGGSGSTSNRRGSGSGSGSGSGDGSSVVTGLIETRANLDLSAMRHRLDNVQTTCAAAKLDCPIDELAQSVPFAEAAPCAGAFVQLRAERPMLVDTCDVAFQLGSAVAVAREVMICPKGKVSLAATRCDGDDLVAELSRADRKERIEVRCTVRGNVTCNRSVFADSEDEAIATFVAEVEELVSSHAWDKLVAMSSRAHQDSQLKEMKQDEATYVAELFTLHWQNNSIAVDDAPVTPADLKRITHLDIKDVVADSLGDTPMYLGVGRASLSDGSTLRVEILIGRENGKLVLTGVSG
jgi:hypothetical protein